MGSQFGALVGGLWGDAGSNFVDLQGGKEAVFGRKPQIADFLPIDLSEEIGKATDADLKNAGSITALLDRLIPGFSDRLKKGLQTSDELMAGEIPEDVQAQIQKSDAFQSLMGGYAGTGMSRSLTARDLGRTSLDLMQAGANSAQLWSKLAETSYDPFIIKTMEQAGTTAANNAGTQATQQFKYNVKAAPDPGALGTFNLDTALGMQMLSFGMGAAGGAMGGAGGGGGGGAAPATGTNWMLLGGQGSSPAYQYNPSTGQYQQVPRAQPVWGGG